MKVMRTATSLRDAPLGTYLGWNVVADGFHKGNYAGGMIPFAETGERRCRTGSKSAENYVEAVKAAAANAVAEKFLPTRMRVSRRRRANERGQRFYLSTMGDVPLTVEI